MGYVDVGSDIHIDDNHENLDNDKPKKNHKILND
jgi:hypothetical protein